MRTSTTGAWHWAGRVTLPEMVALPSAARGKPPVLAATIPPDPPQTRLAATSFTGPTVPTRLAGTPVAAAMTRPTSFTKIWPPGDTLPTATFAVHGAPPAATPPTVTPGVEPTTDEAKKFTSFWARACALAPIEESAAIAARLSRILICIRTPLLTGLDIVLCPKTRATLNGLIVRDFRARSSSKALLHSHSRPERAHIRNAFHKAVREGKGGWALRLYRSSYDD